MTGEGKSSTDKWIEEKGAKYAYGYDRAGKLARYFGVRGIPHAVLVGADGTVLYSGSASGFEPLLEKAVAGALPKPLWEWGVAAKNVKSALLKKQYKAALEGAEKLGEADDGPVIKAAIEGLVKSKITMLKATYDKGDFLGAQELAAELAKQLAGLPEQADAEKVAADIKANADAATVIKHQKAIAKIRDKDPSKRKDLEAAVEDLEKIAEKAAGSYAATEAQALASQYRAKLEKK